MSSEYCTTIGIDVSDRKSHVCVMTKVGGHPRVVAETTIPTTPDGLSGFLATQDRMSAVTFETGTHCRWMDAVARGLGFKVFVANPFRLRMITESATKNDVNDARTLARLTLADVELLRPVSLRSSTHQKMINLHEMRNLLVDQRTGIICQLRGIAKSMGWRIPQCSTAHFHKIDRSEWPKELRDIAWPMIKHLEDLNTTVKTYEKQIRELAETPTFKAQVDRLRQIHCVGLFTATGFVAATGGDMERFAKSRDVGPWLGLTPRQDQSGDTDRPCHITLAGSPFLRRLLTECAQMIMHDGSPDTDLKVKGMRISARGGKVARRKAIMAVARSLAVMMVAMLKKPSTEYVPLSERGAIELEAMRMSA